MMGNEEKKVLVTGASGLLGKELVKKFLEGNFVVLAQYHSLVPFAHKNCRWLWADFSTLEGIRSFLLRNRNRFAGCGYLINNYGPITYKSVSDLEAGDFYFDFHHNVITAFEITGYLMTHSPLQRVVNLGFEFTGEQRPYKKILTYAAAKNALQLVTLSFQERFPGIRFHMVSLPTLVGAEVRLNDGSQVTAGEAAAGIYELMLTDESPAGEPLEGPSGHFLSRLITARNSRKPGR